MDRLHILSGDDKSRLLIAVNKICLAVPLDGDTVRQSLLDSLGEMLYQHQIALTKDHDLLTQPHPRIVTGLDPQGVKEASPSVLNNRRQALTRVWRELGHESDRPTRAEAEEMVQQTDRCVTALTRLYPTEASFRSMSCAFAQMVRAMGHERLAATYRELCARHQPPRSEPKMTISPEDAAQIRAAAVRRAPEDLALLLAWGSDESHCPQRRSDLQSLSWDTHMPNHVSDDGHMPAGGAQNLPRL